MAGAAGFAGKTPLTLGGAQDLGRIKSWPSPGPHHYESTHDECDTIRAKSDQDDRGTLNYITPEYVKNAVGLVRSGRSLSMAVPMNKVAGPQRQ